VTQIELHLQQDPRSIDPSESYFPYSLDSYAKTAVTRCCNSGSISASTCGLFFSQLAFTISSEVDPRFTSGSAAGWRLSGKAAHRFARSGVDVVAGPCERPIEGDAPSLHVYTRNWANASLLLWKRQARRDV
jgi:hypothetical protein